MLVGRRKFNGIRKTLSTAQALQTNGHYSLRAGTRPFSDIYISDFCLKGFSNYAPSFREKTVL